MVVLDFRKSSKDTTDKMLIPRMGLPTGINALDDCILGFDKGEYILIAGRPSMGKSSFVRGSILSIGKEHTVVYFSLEESEDLASELMIANQAKIDYYNLVRGNITEKMKSLLDEAGTALSDYKIIIEHKARNPADMREVLSKITSEETVEAVVVDYIQLMSINTSRERHEELTQISRELKSIASDYNIPVIVTSQLNRNVEHRQSTRPALSDLKGSGSLEQDADKIILLHRPSYYSILFDPEAQDTGDAELIVAKNRRGPVKIVKCGWVREYMAFLNLPSEEDF